MKQGTRFSGAEWADQLFPITVVGVGGIGSWLTLSLSRIGHELYIIDPDYVDSTNVTGGQMYRSKDVNLPKVTAVEQICREFGCINEITSDVGLFNPSINTTDVIIAGVDNMVARKEIFEAWLRTVNSMTHETGGKNLECNTHLFIDGRLNMEMFEVFCVQCNNEEQIREYQEKHLFSDEETLQEDCTAKQTTFAAMGIAGILTAVLSNWATNNKLGYEVREVPFYQRYHLPTLELKKEEVVCLEKSL